MRWNGKSSKNCSNFFAMTISHHQQVLICRCKKCQNHLIVALSGSKCKSSHQKSQFSRMSFRRGIAAIKKQFVDYQISKWPIVFIITELRATFVTSQTANRIACVCSGQIKHSNILSLRFIETTLKLTLVNVSGMWQLLKAYDHVDVTCFVQWIKRLVRWTILTLTRSRSGADIDIHMDTNAFARALSYSCSH